MTVSGSRWMRIFHAALALGFGVFAVVNLISPRDNVDRILGGVQLAFALFWAVLAIRAQSASVDDDGVVIRNRWRTHRLAWNEIKSVDLLNISSRGLPVLRLRDGGSIRIDAALATRRDPIRGAEFAGEIRRRLEKGGPPLEPDSERIPL